MTLPPNLLRRHTVIAAAVLLAACGGGDPETPTAEAPPQADAVDPEGGRAQALAYTLPPLAAAPVGTSGNVVCTNLRLGAITVDNVEVPAGAGCSLSGTNVRGSVQVAPGGVLLAGSAVQIAGSVQGSDAAHVQVTGTTSRIGGNFELDGGGSGTLSGAQVGGDVFVNGIRDVIAVKSATVRGNVQITDNLGGGEISGNSISGNLQCTGNLPAPLASNNTAAAIEGQCALGAGGGGGGGGTLLSGNVTCVGLTIGAIRLDSVIVPAGATCTLLGTTMQGSVEVGANAQLIAENVSVTGNLIADGAAELRVSGRSSVGGSVHVQRGAAATLSAMAIVGDLQIDAMLGPVAASGNRATGNIQVVGNLGGVSLINNRAGGVLQCKENLPAPTGSGNVATLKEDQCRTL